MTSVDTVEPRPSPFIVALRWIAVLPAAAVAGYVAWLLVNLLNRVTFFFQGLDPNSLFNRAFIEAASGLAMGAATVYVGAKVAPFHRAVVVFLLAGLSILAAGFLLFPAIVARSGWAIYSAIWWAIGAGAVAWAVYTGEVSGLD